jgi:hypothetical protein
MPAWPLRPALDARPANRVRPLVHRVTEVGTLAKRIGGSTDATARRIHGAVTDFRRNTVTEELTA